MAEKSLNAPAPRPKRRWLRGLVWVLGIFVVLLVALYFIGTSSAFFKGVILPRVGKSINADVTVTEASIRPFKEVILKNLKVQPKGAEPLLTASEARARYDLMDIIKGRIHVEELTVVSPMITLIEDPDGHSNLDPLLESQKGAAKGKPPSAEKPGKPTAIELKKLSLTDATIRRVKVYKAGTRDTTELSHLNVTVEDVKNGQTGKLLLNAEISVENNPPPPGTNGMLQAKMSGNFVFSLTADLKPASITGNTRLEVTQARGALAELASLGSDLDCEVTPTEVKQLALRFRKGSARLGELRVSGPFDTAKTEGRLKVEILSIDKQVLNLAGAASGIDFGPTTLNSTNDIVLANGGFMVTAAGGVNLSKLQLTRTNQTTPSLDLNASYDLSVDRKAEKALLRVFNLNGTQNGKALLRGELTSPMTLAWGTASNAVGDSALNVSLIGLNLADWKPFVGDLASAGMVNVKMKLLSQQAGKQLTFDVDGQVENLTARSGSNELTQANVTLLVRGKASDLKRFDLSEYKVQVTRQNQSLVEISGSGNYDTVSNTADLPINLTASISPLLQALSRPDLVASAGMAELKGRLIQKNDVQTVTGNLVLADLTGKVGNNEFRSFGATIDLHVNLTPKEIQFPKISGQLSESGKPGGTFSVSGSYDTVKKGALVNAKLSDFNQNGLRPFLEPLLANKKLVSVAINGNLSTQFNPEADSTIKGDLQVTNLVVMDLTNSTPGEALEARMQIDTSLQKQVVEVRQLQIALTPTQRAKNELQLKGRVDMSRSNAFQGSITVAADSLDVTSYYDLFAGEKKTTTTAKPTSSQKPSASAPVTTPAQPETEPEPVTLPFRNFSAQLNVGRFYLREVEITNWQTAAKVDGGRVLLNPCKLSLNGAPVDANVDLDLGVRGYKYDVAFNLLAVPLAPLVNSFQPENKGQMAGTVTAQAKMNGLGITGANLQKSLTGQFDIYTTNLNLSVEHIRKPWLKALVNVVASIPDLAKNLGAGAVSLVQNVSGLGRGGLSDELKKSPIDVITAKGTAGSGDIKLQEAVVQSVLFRAEAAGTVKLAPVLTNSTLEVPVAILLTYPVAQRIGMVSAATPTNAAYVKLPDFYTMKGTLGDPKNQINALALVRGMPGLGEKVGGLVGGKAGDIIGGLLSAPKPAATNAPGATSPNQPAPTNQPPLNNLLDQLLKPKPKKN